MIAMVSWFKKLLAKLGHKSMPRDDGVRIKTSAEINEALRNAKDQTWSSTGDAYRSHPGSKAGRL